MNERKSRSFRALYEEAQQRDEYWTAEASLDFATQVSELMKLNRLRRAELARRLGVTAAYVTKVLRGDANLTLKSLVKIARALGARFRPQIFCEKTLVQNVWATMPIEVQQFEIGPTFSFDVTAVRPRKVSWPYAGTPELGLRKVVDAAAHVSLIMDPKAEPGIGIAQVFLESCTFSHRADVLELPPTTRPELGPVTVRVQLGHTQDRERGFCRIHVATSPDTKPIYNVSLTMIALIRTQHGRENMDIEEYLRSSGPAMLYPFVREALANITGRGRFGPVWLQPLNTKLLQEDEGLEAGASLVPEGKDAPPQPTGEKVGGSG